MSDNQQVPSGDQTDASGDQNNQENNAEAILASKNKILGEKKKVQSELEAARNRLKEFEEKELESKGKQSELIDALRKENKLKEEKLASTVQSYAKQMASAKFREEAIKQGCLDVDLLVGSLDLNQIEVNSENWSVNPDDLKRVLEEKVQKHPTLFKKSGPQVIDGKAVGQSNQQKPSSKDDLISAWKQLK